MRRRGTRRKNSFLERISPGSRFSLKLSQKDLGIFKLNHEKLSSGLSSILNRADALEKDGKLEQAVDSYSSAFRYALLSDIPSNVRDIYLKLESISSIYDNDESGIIAPLNDAINFLEYFIVDKFVNAWNVGDFPNSSLFGFYITKRLDMSTLSLLFENVKRVRGKIDADNSLIYSKHRFNEYILKLYLMLGKSIGTRHGDSIDGNGGVYDFPEQIPPMKKLLF